MWLYHVICNNDADFYGEVFLQYLEFLPGVSTNEHHGRCTGPWPDSRHSFWDRRIDSDKRHQKTSSIASAGQSKRQKFHILRVKESRSQGVKNKGLEWTERTWHDMTNLDDISSISLESHLLPYKCHRVAAQPGTISHNPQLTEIQLTFPDIFLMPPSSRTPNSLWSWFESMTFYETIMEHAVFFCTFLFWCHLPICFSPFCHGLSFDLSQVAAWRQVKQGETWTAASLKNFKI